MADQNNFINPEKINTKDFNLENEQKEAKSLDFEITEKKIETETTLEQNENKEKINFEKVETEEKLDNKIESLISKLKKQKKKPSSIPLVKDEITLRIEKVMEEGLEEAFKELSPIEQQEFKIKGEETAWKIRQALKKTHVKIKEIFKLLFEWLKMLPGINKFFLEQEAKIKADKIVSLKKYK